MIGSIKNLLWEQVRKKQVSALMIFDCDGRIIWQKGRPIIGKSIDSGYGFPRNLIKKIITDQRELIVKENVEVMIFGDELSESAKNLYLKTVLIISLKKGYLFINYSCCVYRYSC